MLRNVRDRFRLRRPRRHDPPPMSPVLTPHAQPQRSSFQASQPPLHASDVSTQLDQSDNQHYSEPTVHSDINVMVDKHYSKSASSPQVEDYTHQPRVFRNRSLEYAHRRDRQFLGLLTGRALRPFNRSKYSPNLTRSPRDRPLESPVEQQIPAETAQMRNDDSFSSLPSTHASKDPFLNDDVPVDISRNDGREDRPRDFKHGSSDFVSRPQDARFLGGEPPQSINSGITSRKRTSLWKRKYDPHNEFQAPHERDILKAIALSEASAKEHNVHAAQQLSTIVDEQVRDLDIVLSDVDRQVERAQLIADKLPSVNDSRFEPYLRMQGPEDDSNEMVTGKGSTEQSIDDLQWTERVWDIEALVAEKQFGDAVTEIDRLQADGISSSASPRTIGKLQELILQLASEMSSCCAQGGGECAAIFAPLLGKLGMADHARQVALDFGESELITELKYIIANRQDATPRSVNVILDKTLSIFKYTHDVYMKISSSDSSNSSDASLLVAWMVEQSDKIYKEFVSPVLTRMKKADPVTILATIEAVRHRRLYQNPSLKNEKSLSSVLETRMASLIRKELDGPVRDAERQLMERARMYASAVPRDWSVGPYQSGRAVCDELNVLSRGLEGSLMNLGADTDVLIGNLLVRPAFMYCTTLLEMGSKAVTEDESLNHVEVQQSVFATFVIIGKALLRLHQKFTTIPMLERVGSVLTSANLGEIRILQAEVFARRGSIRIHHRHTGAGKLGRILTV